jgi:hypothetical protein
MTSGTLLWFYLTYHSRLIMMRALNAGKREEPPKPCRRLVR